MKHNDASDFVGLEKELKRILFVANASANFYMFSGGTNFGFTNGAKITTSYNFNSPLTEWGNYTGKVNYIFLSFKNIC